MLAIGKLKPERMNIGLSTKKFDANACCCVVHRVEINRPMASVLSRNRQVPSSSTSGLPSNGMLNQSVPTPATSNTSTSPMRKNGSVLPMMNSTGRIGVTRICSSVPTSRSRTIAKAVRLTMVTRVSVPITPGTKNQRLFRFGLYQ